MNSLHTRHYQDLNFTVVAGTQDHSVDFTIFEIEGWMEGGNKGVFDVPVWDADNLAHASKFAHGYVKWDGCSNWHFDGQERGMLHGCSRQDLTRLGEVLARCWDLAGELLPNWSP